MATNDKNVLSDTIRAARADLTLQDVLAFIRERAFTHDFFLGYSLLEAVQDRIDTIGSLDAAEDLYNKKTSESTSKQQARTPSGLPTKQASLLALKERGLAAIAAARNVELSFSVEPIDDVDEPTPLDNEGNFFVA